MARKVLLHGLQKSFLRLLAPLLSVLLSQSLTKPSKLQEIAVTVLLMLPFHLRFRCIQLQKPIVRSPTPSDKWIPRLHSLLLDLVSNSTQDALEEVPDTLVFNIDHHVQVSSATLATITLAWDNFVKLKMTRKMDHRIWIAVLISLPLRLVQSKNWPWRTQDFVKPLLPAKCNILTSNQPTE